MATKNISRSAIEGGRANTWERRYSNRQFRARERQWLSRVNQDHEVAEESVTRPRVSEPKAFTDKLNPVYRWLESKVGKPWNETHSIMRKRFDDRKISGHHVLYDHMLSEVGKYYGYTEHAPWPPSPAPTAFYVDGDGLLQRYENHWRWSPPGRGRRSHLTPEWQVTAFVGNRKVIDYGSVQFWAVPTDGIGWRSCRHQIVHNVNHLLRWPSRFCAGEHRRAADNIDIECHLDPGWRQDRRLTAEELEIWSNMDCWNMSKFVIYLSK